jgi:hypothetical protein
MIIIIIEVELIFHNTHTIATTTITTIIMIKKCIPEVAINWTMRNKFCLFLKIIVS